MIVMGLFDIFFRKKERNLEKINLENLEEAAKKKISEQDKNFEQEAANFLSRIKQQKEKLKSSISKLSEAQVTDKVNPQLLNVAMTSRKSFVKKFGDIVRDQEQKDISISIMSVTYKTLQYQINEIDSSTVAEFASIKEVFKNEAFAVTDDLKELKRIYDDFGEKLKRATAEVLPFEEIEDKIKIIRAEKEKLENFRKDLEKMEQKNESLKKENEMMQINLQKLEEGEEWKQYLEFKKQLQQKENEKTELISKVVQTFSSVERPLKKLNNLLKKTESEFDTKMLEKYFASPFDAFLEDYEKKSINLALKEAAKNIEENKIDEKKSLEKIKEMISSDTFGNLAKEWQNNTSEILELNEKIMNSDVAKKRDEMLKNISDRENEMKQNSKEKMEKQMNSIDQDFAEHKDELKDLASKHMSMEVDI